MSADEFDDIDPDLNRDASHFRALVAARESRDAGERTLFHVVEAARAAGESWRLIGSVLDMTAEEAERAFGTPPPYATPPVISSPPPSFMYGDELIGRTISGVETVILEENGGQAATRITCTDGYTRLFVMTVRPMDEPTNPSIMQQMTWTQQDSRIAGEILWLGTATIDGVARQVASVNRMPGETIFRCEVELPGEEPTYAVNVAAGQLSCQARVENWAHALKARNR